MGRVTKFDYHESFYRHQQEDVMKSIIEFDLPEDSENHYNAMNGFKYRMLISLLKKDLIETITQSHGTDEARYLSVVLGRIEDLAVDMDVKLNRK